MKRYDHYGTLDGGGPAEAIEEPDGDWVPYADAQAAISAAVAAERERCANVLEDLSARTDDNIGAIIALKWAVEAINVRANRPAREPQE